MKILHLAWEYPPLVYGGLGRHVGAVATSQSRLGHQVTVITQAESTASDDTLDGVRVIRVPRDPPDLPFTESTLLAWVAGLEESFTRALAGVGRQQRPDVIHGHDWMIAHTALTAREFFERPLVTTIHATEAGRHQGWLPNDLSVSIHTVEWWLARQSDRVITCSDHMRWEAGQLFDARKTRISVIPNGIDLSQWSTTAEAAAAQRARYAPDGELVVFAGRLEWEKGVHTLIDAMARLRKVRPGIRMVVAGKGGQADDLRRKARAMRMGATVVFTDWLPEADLHALVAAADVVVVPSMYEPFGLVALEAAAMDRPLVVSDVGGLAEFADGGARALTFPAGDEAALAAAIAATLDDPEGRRRRVVAAARSLRTIYTWDRVARRTIRAYQAAVRSPNPRRPEFAAVPAPQPGNLLRGA